ADVGEHLCTISEIGGAARFLDGLGAGADELGAVRNSGREPFHEGQIGLHLDPIERHDMPVHAALQATVDTLLQRADAAFAPAILGELAPHSRQRPRVGLRPGLEVAVLAGEAAAREPLLWIGCGRTDLVWSVGEECVSVFDELAKRIISDSADAWRRP